MPNNTTLKYYNHSSYQRETVKFVLGHPHITVLEYLTGFTISTQNLVDRILNIDRVDKILNKK